MTLLERLNERWERMDGAAASKIDRILKERRESAAEIDRLRGDLKNIATQKTTEELKAEGEQEYDDADFEGGYDAIIHIARRAMQPTP